MNGLERQIDRLGPQVSVRLRLAKARIRRDVMCKLLPHYLSPTETVVDIGAHRGVYTLLMSRAVGPRGRVHAFEPYPANVGRLKVLASTRRNIVVHPYALSSRSGTASLNVPKLGDHQLDALSSLRCSVAVEAESIPVPVHTFDEIARAQIAGPIDLIKCDVEGLEDEVIAGAWTTITEHKPVLFVEIEQRHRQAPVGDLIERLLEVGYEGYFIDETRPRPIGMFDIEEHQLRFLTSDFVPFSMPAGYISDFMFVPKR